MKAEFTNAFEISALKKMHMSLLLDAMFAALPDAKADGEAVSINPYPLMNLDSKTFISELIREKVFLMMGEEIPYTSTAVVDDIKNRSEGLTYIKARILTTESRYKRMIIGSEGRKIKEIGSYARKEIALAIGKKVYLDLTVDVDPHWQELYS
jgi:GTP-binding protein Era